MQDNPPPKLLDQVRAKLRTRHYSLRTEQAYCDWIRRFILFHGKRHPVDMSAQEVESFLSHLAVERTVAASTQNQAKSALLFLYREVLNSDLPWLDNITKAKASQRLPVVLTREEVTRLLIHLDGTHWLMASLLYGTGMRLMECLRLRVKDVDFARREILVRDGKGMKDRGDNAAHHGFGALAATSGTHARHFTRRTWPRVSGRCTSRTLWPENTRVPRNPGVGSMCSHPPRV